eukprot:7076362-Prymnesium_polylepis.2
MMPQTKTKCSSARRTPQADHEVRQRHRLLARAQCAENGHSAAKPCRQPASRLRATRHGAAMMPVSSAPRRAASRPPPRSHTAPRTHSP